MVCNQNLIFYVLRHYKIESKVICAHLNGSDISRVEAYTSDAKILQLQAK